MGKRLTKEEVEMRPGETTLGYYERIAATADNRLRAIESLRHQTHFTNVDQYAYARAMRDIQSYGGTKRFSTKPPENETLLREKIQDIKRFLNAPTSTKSGVIEVYAERANTLNADYGLNMTWQQLADLFESGLYDTLDSKYASQTAFKTIGVIRGLTKKQIETIKKAQEKNLKGETLVKALGKIEDDEISDLFKSNSILLDNVIDTIQNEDIDVLMKMK